MDVYEFVPSVQITPKKKKSTKQCFNKFFDEETKRLKFLYPFLTPKQIKGKVHQRWQKRTSPKTRANVTHKSSNGLTEGKDCFTSPISNDVNVYKHWKERRSFSSLRDEYGESDDFPTGILKKDSEKKRVLRRKVSFLEEPRVKEKSPSLTPVDFPVSSPQSSPSNTVEEELSSGNGKKYVLRQRKEISYHENSVSDVSTKQICYKNPEQVHSKRHSLRKSDMEKCNLNKESSSGYLTSGNAFNLSELNYNVNEKEESFLKEKENKPVNIKQLGKRSYQKLHHPNLRKNGSFSETEVGSFDNLLSGKCTWSYKNCEPDNINTHTNKETQGHILTGCYNKHTNKETQRHILTGYYNLSESDSDTEYVLQSRQDLEKNHKDVLKSNKLGALNTQTEKEKEGENNVVQNDRNASFIQLNTSEEKSFHNSLEPLQKNISKKSNETESRKEYFDKVKCDLFINNDEKEKVREKITAGKESRNDTKNKTTDYHYCNYDFEEFENQIELQDEDCNSASEVLHKRKKRENNCLKDKNVFGVIRKQNNGIKDFKLPIVKVHKNGHLLSNENVNWKIWHENGNFVSTKRPEKLCDLKENNDLCLVEQTLSCNLKNRGETQLSKNKNYASYSVYSPHFSDSVDISETSDFELFSTPERKRRKPEQFEKENVQKKKKRKKNNKKEKLKDSSEATGLTSACRLAFLNNVNENNELESFMPIEFEHDKESEISETTFSEKSVETDCSYGAIDTLPFKKCNLTPVMTSNKLTLSPVLASLRCADKIKSTRKDVNEDLLNDEEFIDKEEIPELNQEALVEQQVNTFSSKLPSINELLDEESTPLNDCSISPPVAEASASSTFVYDIISRLRQICSPLKKPTEDTYSFPRSPLEHVSENALLSEDSGDCCSSDKKYYAVLNENQPLKGMNKKREKGTPKATLTSKQTCSSNERITRNKKIHSTFTTVQRGKYSENDYKSTFTTKSHQLSLPSKEYIYSCSEEARDSLSPFLDEDGYLEHQNKMSHSVNTPPVTPNYLVSSEQELSVVSTTDNEGEKCQNSYMHNSVTRLKEANYRNISTEKTYKEDTTSKQTQVWTDENFCYDEKEEEGVFSLPSSCEELFPIKISNLAVKEDMLLEDAGKGLLCDFFEKENLETESSAC